MLPPSSWFSSLQLGSARRQHETALAEVEGDFATELAMGPGQSENQRQRYEQTAAFGFGGADFFADGVDTLNSGIDDINVQIVDLLAAYEQARAQEQIEIALDASQVLSDSGEWGILYEPCISPTPTERDERLAILDRRHAHLHEDLDRRAEHIRQMFADGPTRQEMEALVERIDRRRPRPAP